MKKHLVNIQRLRAGTYRDITKGIFLDRNERVQNYSQDVLDALWKHVAKKVKLNLYPELLPFYKKLSDWLGVNEDQIFVTDGVCSGIKSLIESLTSPGQTVIFPTPTFALYPVYCQMFQQNIVTVGYKKDYSLDVDRLFNSINEDSSIVFLPNPNVPIAGTLDLSMVEEIASYCEKRGTYLAVDEVYYPFGGPTAIKLINKFSNVFVIRSFSKAFGLAGVRVGYVLGSSENIDYVSKVRTGYENNSVSMEIVSFFIDHIELIESYIDDVKEGFNFLKANLDEINLPYNGGNEGNFIFVDIGDKNKADLLVSELRKKDLYIRGGWPEPFDKGVAITGAPLNIMKRFMEGFLEVYNTISK